MPKKRSNTPKAAAKPDDRALADSAASNPSKRIIPLGGGTWCYLLDPITGTYDHLKVESRDMDAALSQQSALSEAYAQRLRRELTALAHGDFPAALARYDRAAAGDAEQEAA